MKEPKKILIVRTDRLGDLILSLPVIYNLRKNYPQSHIAFMTIPANKDILENNPYIDELILYDKRGKHKSFWASLKFSKYLSKKDFDCAFILHSTNRVNLMSFYAGIPVRVGWNRKMGFLLTHSFKMIKDKGERHERDYTLELLERMGLNIYSRDISLTVDDNYQHVFQDFFKDKDMSGLKIALGVTASCNSKIWPWQNFMSLTQRFIDEYNAKIIILGDKKAPEHSLGIFEEKSNNLFDLREKTSLKQVMALLKNTDLFIGNDSGLVHLASALGVASIAIFGRKQPGLSPRRWMPLGRNSFFIHKDVGCLDCLAHDCMKEFACIKSITVDDVYSRAEGILKGKQS